MKIYQNSTEKLVESLSDEQVMFLLAELESDSSHLVNRLNDLLPQRFQNKSPDDLQKIASRSMENFGVLVRST